MTGGPPDEGPPTVNGVTQWRITAIEKELDRKASKVELDAAREDIGELRGAINRLTWSIIGFAFTVAGSAVALLLASGGAAP